MRNLRGRTTGINELLDVVTAVRGSKGQVQVSGFKISWLLVMSGTIT